MDSINLPEELDKISSFMNSESNSISTNFSEFGYRERIRIERCLFLLIKSLCKKELDYNLQGFSKGHIEKLSYISSKKLSVKTLILIIDQTFQLKTYLQTLSSESAYVRGDALSKLGLNRKNVFTFIQEELKRIVDKVNFLNVEQSH